MREQLKAVARFVGGILDLRDAVCAAGLGGVGYGLAQVSEPLAWVVVGAALFWLSVRRPDGSA